MIKNLKPRTPKYYLDSSEFVVENYNFARPFANFFPGIAGKYGIPMWVFYVNRGQAIFSFGTKDKDHAILEFFPANTAWQLASLRGFRTFIKLTNRKQALFYEPFNNGLANLELDTTSKMHISPYDLKIAEINRSLGLLTTIEYFTVPNDSYAALARIVTIKNLSRAQQKMQVLDGLPQIVPFGTSNQFLKKLSRTIEAWMVVNNLEKGVPFYKLDVDPTDRPEILHIKEGNFFLGFLAEGKKAQIIRPIVDPEVIFGPITDFSYPRQFLAEEKFRHIPEREIPRNKTPCGFLLLDIELKPAEERTFYSLIGYMRNCEILNSSLTRIASASYINQKREENKKLIGGLVSDIATASSSREFNLYAQQTYLDNIMRGGYPVTFKSNSSKSVFYIYSRKHGDLERDYNKFHLQPTYFSQGNGNYRDINQNRRCDVWFNPEVKDESIITFLNLLQADGFNPLVYKGNSFQIESVTEFKTALKKITEEKDIPTIIPLLEKPFTPGEIILLMEENKIKLKVSPDDFLDCLLTHCVKIQETEHGEGFWTDHWTYNLDLLESYAGVYPENIQDLLFDKRVFTFYDNAETVRPREEKYVLVNGLVRQLHSVAADHAKKEIIHKRNQHLHTVRTDYGKGKIYQTTLINKLLCLLVNKLASLDPFGMGIEMEANKPNWFDALNGLPALFGSSTCETFELKRLTVYLKKALKNAGVENLPLTEEIRELLFGLDGLIKKDLSDNSKEKDYNFWDKSHSLREEYLSRTRLGFSGKETPTICSELIAILDRAIRKIELGLAKALNKKGDVYYAYFINEVVQHEIIKDHFVRPIKFVQKKLPFFLEAQVHALRLTGDINQARKLYRGTRLSPLYDKSLKMYKVTAPLKGMPLEIGRCRAFTPGWLENESIWVHMEYKYLLEILKKGLYQEFYADFKNVLIPFQNPRIYGRSILENSSFLVSSAFLDKKLHGNGFIARLSGSTAEFLNLWLIMNVGKQPFFINEDNQLNLRLSPALAGWLFTAKENTYGFNFLGTTWVVYHNPKRKDTFGRNAAKVKKITLRDKNGKAIEIFSDTIPALYAEQVRAHQISRIEVFLG